MNLTRTVLTATPSVFALILLASCGRPAAAQFEADVPGRGDFRSLAELDASFSRRFAELERMRVAGLAALAARKDGEEADQVYRELFRAAIALDLVRDAEPAAQNCLKSPKTSPDTRALATLILVLERAEVGLFQQSLDRLSTFLTVEGGGQALGVAEAFLHRLIRLGRYTQAQEICSLMVKQTRDPAVAAHFKARMRPLSLIGKPAPPIVATDVDGKPFRLENLKGKVVLVVFWATWCPPCLAEMPRLNTLAEAFQSRGLELLGVNVDAHHEDIKDAKQAIPIVRHALIEQNVAWPNVLNDDGPGNIAEAYGISTLPANLLIGRDGAVVGVDLSGPFLDSAVKKALGTTVTSQPRPQ
jgi:thiol-disulfide isomerase/thioredoxin